MSIKIKPKSAPLIILIIILIVTALTSYSFGNHQSNSRQIKPYYVTLYDDNGEIRGSLLFEQVDDRYTIIRTKVYSYTVETAEMRMIFCGINQKVLGD